MIKPTLPSKAKDIIIQDAIQRDLTTARRIALLDILWNERYLTRAQLIARVEFRLGRNCFGASAWQDTFYRDMRVVKQALKAAGSSLLYYIVEIEGNLVITCRGNRPCHLNSKAC